MRLLRAQMPRRPEYERSSRAPVIPWVIDFGSRSAAGGFGSTPPDSEVGDLILVLAGEHASDVIPSTGADFTQIDADNSGGVTTVAANLCYKFAAAQNDNITGFTGADKLGAITFRNVRREANGTILGATAYQPKATTFDYPALSFSGERLIVIGHQPDVSAPTPWPPAGFTNLVAVGNPQLTMAVGNAPVSSWAGLSAQATGANQAGVTFAVALRGELGRPR